MLWIGLALTAATATLLVAGYLRAPKLTPFPRSGWVGLAIIAVAEALLFAGIAPVPVYFTPIVWTGYILAVDSAIYSIRRRSLIRGEPQAFVWMAVLSIFLWSVFEGYNLYLHNWMYVGLPNNDFVRYAGYGWAFATIWPAILETAELLLVTWLRHHSPPPVPGSRPTHWLPIAAGLLMVTVPPLLPSHLGVYMFGCVWLGFIFLVDPINDSDGRPSLRADWRNGYRARLWALLLSGAACGFLWEFWNFWAQGKWFYIFPILESWTIFEMPAPGFLGFPAFALEVFVLYVFAAGQLDLPLYPISPRPEPPAATTLGLGDPTR